MSETNITTEQVQIPVGEATMGGYLARPAGDGSYPAVIVFMEIFGVNSHIRDVTERVAREGYVAIAPDYFHRTAPGMELGYDDAGMAEGMNHLGQLEAEQMISDAEATLGFLRGRAEVKSDKVGCMGFCIGGHMTYLTACETDVVAAASFYGGGIAAPQGPGGSEPTVGRTPRIRGSLQCFFGGQDAMIPADQVAAVREALGSAGTKHDVIVYPDADHGFHCDQRGSFNEAASADAWQRTLRLFADELGGA
jgi:carboxymethylenebutenolidase